MFVKVNICTLKHLTNPEGNAAAREAFGTAVESAHAVFNAAIDKAYDTAYDVFLSTDSCDGYRATKDTLFADCKAAQDAMQAVFEKIEADYNTKVQHDS